MCSNSFKSNFIDNSSGLLKQEMRMLGSVCLEAADYSAVPAGGALAVERNMFSEYITEKKFVVASDENDELYVFIEAKNNHPDKPRIIYDGFDHAVFLRTPNEKIILDYINPEVRSELCKSKRIIMVETISDKIKESYYVDMQIVPKIPVDWTKIGLTTWDEATISAK